MALAVKRFQKWLKEQIMAYQAMMVKEREKQLIPLKFFDSRPKGNARWVHQVFWLLISIKDMKMAFGRVVTLMLNKTFQITIRFIDNVHMIHKSMITNEDFVAMNLTIFNLMELDRRVFDDRLNFDCRITENLTRNALKIANKI